MKKLIFCLIITTLIFSCSKTDPEPKIPIVPTDSTLLKILVSGNSLLGFDVTYKDTSGAEIHFPTVDSGWFVTMPAIIGKEIYCKARPNSAGAHVSVEYFIDDVWRRKIYALDYWAVLRDTVREY